MAELNIAAEAEVSEVKSNTSWTKTKLEPKFLVGDEVRILLTPNQNVSLLSAIYAQYSHGIGGVSIISDLY